MVKVALAGSMHHRTTLALLDLLSAEGHEVVEMDTGGIRGQQVTDLYVDDLSPGNNRRERRRFAAIERRRNRGKKRDSKK